MKKIYNEVKYAELIYKKGFQSMYIKYELTLLVKYLSQIKEMTKKEIEEYVYTFCEKNIEGYNEVIYFKMIDNAIKRGRNKNNRLIVVENIPILKNELLYIDKIPFDTQYKKLLLAFLINKKISLKINNIINNCDSNELSMYFEGSVKKYREIYKMANITSNKYKIDDMINELVNGDIIESVIKGDILLKFIGDMYESWDEEITVINKYTKEKSVKTKKHIKYEYVEDDIYDTINDFDNIGYVFDYYKDDKKIKKCEVCGKYIKIKNNYMKYCDNCSNEKRLVRQRIYMNNKI